MIHLMRLRLFHIFFSIIINLILFIFFNNKKKKTFITFITFFFNELFLNISLLYYLIMEKNIFVLDLKVSNSKLATDDYF